MYCPLPYPVFTLTVLAEGHTFLIPLFLKSRAGEDFAIGSYILGTELRRRDNINMDILLHEDILTATRTENSAGFVGIISM
jgi:hypothetical protein